MPIWLWLPVLLLAVLAAMVALLIWLLPRGVPVAFGRAQFARDRAALEAQFFEAAASSGKPRGLRWTKCDWGEAIEFARERRTGQLMALVSVTISFEAIEGSDMEGLAAVGNLRNATAVFFFDGVWSTTGRAVFNLNPDEAIRHFGAQYERLGGSRP